MQTVLDYLLNVVYTTLLHIAILIAPVVILGLIMHLISKQIEKTTIQLTGAKVYLYTFGWIGTAVHELGHLIFALIFGHHITNVKLFSLDPNNPEAGYVQHSFNKKNIYQNLGNFFIGIGPILLGGSALFIIGYLLLDLDFKTLYNNDLKIFDSSVTESIKFIFISLYDTFVELLKNILTPRNIVWWKYILFFYLLFSIGTSISLSKADIKGSFSGLLIFIGLLFIFNLSTFWMGNFSTKLFIYISNISSGFYLMMMTSIIFNLFFLLALKPIGMLIPSKSVKKK